MHGVSDRPNVSSHQITIIIIIISHYSVLSFVVGDQIAHTPGVVLRSGEARD